MHLRCGCGDIALVQDEMQRIRCRGAKCAGMMTRRARTFSLSKKKQIDEMENGVWVDRIRNCIERKFDSEKTQDKKNRARHWVNNGAVARDAPCKMMWFLWHRL